MILLVSRGAKNVALCLHAFIPTFVHRPFTLFGPFLSSVVEDGKMKVRIARLVAYAVLALGLAGVSPAAAQVFTGRIDATVTDSTGAVLPGVTVDITGPQNATTVTDAQG